MGIREQNLNQMRVSSPERVTEPRAGGFWEAATCLYVPRSLWSRRIMFLHLVSQTCSLSIVGWTTDQKVLGGLSSCSRVFECVTAAGGAAGVEVTGLAWAASVDQRPPELDRTSHTSRKPADKTGNLSSSLSFGLLLLSFHPLENSKERVESKKRRS